MVEKLGVMDAATSKALATQRTTSPEDHPEPVCKLYTSRCVLGGGLGKEGKGVVKAGRVPL